MEVHIQDVIATVRTVGPDAVVAPQAMEKIVATALGAWRAEQEYNERRFAERRLAGGGGHPDWQGEV